MRVYMAQTVLCEGKPYYTVDGQLRRYPKFIPEDYVLLKLTPCDQANSWYRWNQEVPPGSPRELVQAAKEFSMLKIGCRSDMVFYEPEVIDVPKFLAGEIVSHKELTSGEIWGLIFERAESEMSAYMRELDQLERGELIPSMVEISAMQICRSNLIAQRKTLPREELLFLLQVEKPLELLRDTWLEYQETNGKQIFLDLFPALHEKAQQVEYPTMQM